MEFKVKTFDQLSLEELYQLLQIRSAIFVVEQNCVYQDIDDLDQESLHCFITDKGKIVACLRAYQVEDEKTVKIGRVLSLEHGKGYGYEVMARGLPEAIRFFRPAKLMIHAQKYAQGFYEMFGFEVVSEPFLEDGIVHVRMEKRIEE